MNELLLEVASRPELVWQDLGIDRKISHIRTSKGQLLQLLDVCKPRNCRSTLPHFCGNLLEPVREDSHLRLQVKSPQTSLAGERFAVSRLLVSRI